MYSCNILNDFLPNFSMVVLQYFKKKKFRNNNFFYRYFQVLTNFFGHSIWIISNDVFHYFHHFELSKHSWHFKYSCMTTDDFKWKFNFSDFSTNFYQFFQIMDLKFYNNLYIASSVFQKFWKNVTLFFILFWSRFQELLKHTNNEGNFSRPSRGFFGDWFLIFFIIFIALFHINCNLTLLYFQNNFHGTIGMLKKIYCILVTCILL